MSLDLTELSQLQKCEAGVAMRQSMIGLGREDLLVRGNRILERPLSEVLVAALKIELSLWHGQATPFVAAEQPRKGKGTLGSIPSSHMTA